jgi:hypothetical protein
MFCSSREGGGDGIDSSWGANAAHVSTRWFTGPALGALIRGAGWTVRAALPMTSLGAREVSASWEEILDDEVSGRSRRTVIAPLRRRLLSSLLIDSRGTERKCLNGSQERLVGVRLKPVFHHPVIYLRFLLLALPGSPFREI